MPAGLPPLIGELAEGPADRERSVSPKARFAERVVDRAFDASVLAPLAWTLQGIHPHTAVLALVGLGTSFLASYERARGQGLGYRGTESPAYWAARTVILVVGLLAGYELGALIAFVALTGVAAAVRAWNVVVQQRRLRRRRVPA